MNEREVSDARLQSGRAARGSQRRDRFELRSHPSHRFPRFPRLPRLRTRGAQRRERAGDAGGADRRTGRQQQGGPHMKLLIAYASRYGQTEKIARRIADVAGEPARAISVAEAEDIPLEECDALIVAGGVYFGRHDRRLENWVSRHLANLSTMEAALVSVSGGGSEQYVHGFSRRTGWVPEISAAFKGGQAFTKYGLFVRLLMWAIARKEGQHP